MNQPHDMFPMPRASDALFAQARLAVQLEGRIQVAHAELMILEQRIQAAKTEVSWVEDQLKIAKERMNGKEDITTKGDSTHY